MYVDIRKLLLLSFTSGNRDEQPVSQLQTLKLYVINYVWYKSIALNCLLNKFSC